MPRARSRRPLSRFHPEIPVSPRARPARLCAPRHPDALPFTEALNGSETGQAYRALAAKRSGETNADERHRAWEAFAAAFKNDYSDRLAQAASDETSKQALDALSVYVARNADQQAAEEALKRGEQPETNPAYTQALAEATDAHATLTTCMPHWPVVF